MRRLEADGQAEGTVARSVLKELIRLIAHDMREMRSGRSLGEIMALPRESLPVIEGRGGHRIPDSKFSNESDMVSGLL